MPEFDADRDHVVSRARMAGLVEMLVVGGIDGGGALLRALAVAERFSLPATAGVHPHEARLADHAAYEELRSLARAARVVAIGEIGLDYHYDHSPRDVQREVFRRQLRLARDSGLPVVVHTREADSDTAEILEREGAGETGGVIHCFTGGVELAERALAIGFHLSFSGIVTFARAETIQQVARACPEDRLLVETDSPFLAPVPYRGKRNEPAFVREVARKVAELRGVEPRELASTVRRNYGRLFHRPV